MATIGRYTAACNIGGVDGEIDIPVFDSQSSQQIAFRTGYKYCTIPTNSSNAAVIGGTTVRTTQGTSSPKLVTVYFGNTSVYSTYNNLSSMPIYLGMLNSKPGSFYVGSVIAGSYQLGVHAASGAEAYNNSSVTMHSLSLINVEGPFPPTFGSTITYSSTNGIISGPSSASSGETVTLTVTPDTGYALSSLAIYKTASQDPVDYSKVSDTTYTFVMPGADVTVTGIFARAYVVSISCSPSTAGTITRTPSSELVIPGMTVSFTVTSDSNWQVSTMDLSQDVNVQWNPDTLTGTFEMPERLVYGTVYLSNRLDPNAGGGTSEPEVPSGGFDNESDIIAIPAYADRGVVNVTAGKGLITLWNPTNAEIADIGSYLYSTDWGDALYQGFRDFFVKPLESAISLHVLPITPSRSSTKQIIRFGPHNSGVSSYAVTNQYATVDLGTLAIEPYWDSYLDYNPFTKIQIYLPYIGTQDIDTDIVMGKTIGVRYKFDVLTGACVAFLYTVEGSTPSIFAEFVGESAMQIPLCSSDYSRVIGGIIQAAATVVTGRMVTGAAMKASNELVASKQVELEAASNRLDSFKRKRPRTEEGKAAKLAGIEAASKEKADATNGLAMAQAKAGRTQASMYAAELRAVPYEVGSVLGGKATTTISGSVAGGAGLLGSQVPYLLIRRPKQSLPNNYKKYVGYPSNIYAVLGSLTGYTRIEQADLEGIPCTDAELAMIYKALKEGVYL